MQQIISDYEDASWPISNQNIGDLYNNCVWDHGDGIYVYLDSGQRMADFTSGATVVNLGHGNARIAKAIHEQACKITNTYFFENAAKRRYREMLFQHFPDCYNKVFFLSSGSEAIDCALKVTVINGRKPIFASTYTSFHGRSYTCFGLTQLPFSSDMAHNPLHTHFFEFPQYPSNDPAAAKASIDSALANLKTMLAQHPDIATLILEPYQGDGGIIFPEPYFFREVQDICRQHDVLFIFDEVQSGFCRTGSLFSFMELGIQPDLICIGKAMANGLPCSAVVVKDTVGDKIRTEHMANSFGGNPLSMAGAIEVLNIINASDLAQKTIRKGAWFKQKLATLKEQFPFVKDIRGKGMIYGIELDPDTSLARSIGPEFVHTCFEEGMLVMPPKGALKNVIKLSPPLIITQPELEMGLQKLLTVCHHLENKLGSTP